MYSSKLDFFFPFVVFSYGVLLVFVLENGRLKKLASRYMADLYHQLQMHRRLAWICFWVGGLWSLQNLIVR